MRWTAFGAMAVLLPAIVFIPFLRSLPARTRRMFLPSSAVDVGGAVGVEAATLHLDQNDLLNTLGHDLWTAVEESTEMAGVIFFIRSLLSHTEVELGTGHPETGTDSHGVHVRRAVPDGTAEQRQAPAAGHRSPAGGSALAPPPDVEGMSLGPPSCGSSGDRRGRGAHSAVGRFGRSRAA